MNSTEDNVVAIWKQKGETPLQALYRLRESLPEYEKAVLSYAGRLDPMAEGVLPVLVGKSANQNRKSYLSVDKEYEVEILCGAATDTYDLLGIVTSTSATLSGFDREKMESACLQFKGERDQLYPPYSSKTIGGTALHELSRKGILDPKLIPSSKVNIKDIKILSWETLQRSELATEIHQLADTVAGDFRQQEIIQKWEDCLRQLPDMLLIMKIRVECTSGTYMRSLAHEVGQKVGIPSLAYSIVRTRAGLFLKENCVM